MSSAEDTHVHGQPRGTSIILPKQIYLKDTQGLFLAQRVLNGEIPKTMNLVFRGGNPNYECVLETTEISGNRYRFAARNGNNFVRHSQGAVPWYSADPPDSGSVSFEIVTLGGNKVHFKDSLNPFRFLSNGMDSFLENMPVGVEHMGESTEMEILSAAIKSEITDVKYNIDDAKIYEVDPLVALSTSVRNDSEIPGNETLTFTYEKWTVGTWNNTAGIEIGAKTTFTAGVPFIASAEFEISVTAAYSHEWGGEVGIRQTITTSTTVTVPPKTQGQALVLVRNAKMDVPFTCTRTTLWSNGNSQTSKVNGVYNNVDSWHIDVQLNSLRKI